MYTHVISIHKKTRPNNAEQMQVLNAESLHSIFPLLPRTPDKRGLKQPPINKQKVLLQIMSFVIRGDLRSHYRWRITQERRVAGKSLGFYQY